MNRSPGIDIIWNSTLTCPHDCAVCCVDAVHVTRQGTVVRLRSEGLTETDEIPFVTGEGSIYDQALRHRQQRGLELTLKEKLRVLDHLDGYDAKLDISGGDPLRVAENIELLRAAAATLGQNNVTLTATGIGLAAIEPAQIAKHIGELNFTYDSPDMDGNVARPDRYAAINLKRASEFARLGVRTRAECPLTTHILDDDLLRRIYRNLSQNGIDKLLVMRLFPVGRGQLMAGDIPSADSHRRAIAVLRDEESRLGRPQVTLQCALRRLDASVAGPNPCDMVRESFGLMADGVLLMSPWAIDARGKPLDPTFVLGNLATTPLSEILASDVIAKLRPRLDENHGHCKIFTFLNSRKSDPIDRLLDQADPLYPDARDQEASLPLAQSPGPSRAQRSTSRRSSGPKPRPNAQGAPS